jgi:hypothetical protein
MSFQADPREIRCSSLIPMGSKHVVAFLVSQIVFASIWALMATTVLCSDSCILCPGKMPSYQQKGRRIGECGDYYLSSRTDAWTLWRLLQERLFFLSPIAKYSYGQRGAQIAATIQSKNQTFHNTACKTLCNSKTLSTS